MSDDIIESLRLALRYDPETGDFFSRRDSHSGRWKEGRQIGSRQSNGYMAARVDGRLLLLHRVAFALMAGRWPSAHVDHRNGDRTDNRWQNLREATPLQNQWNRQALYGGSHISHNNTNPFRAQIRFDGKRIHLGYFSTRKAAEEAYRKAEKEFREAAFPASDPPTVRHRAPG